MTANPVRPARYRPGKGQDAPSESEYETEEEEQEPKPKRKPKPALSTSKVTGAFQEVNLSERRKQETARLEAQNVAAWDINEDEFETESEEEVEGGVSAPQHKTQASSESEDSGAGEEEEGEGEDSSDESSSEDEAPAKLLRPTFIRKNQRDTTATSAPVKTEDQLHAESESRRKAKADELIQQQLERNAALRAAEKKAWDDSDVEDAPGGTEADVDDTDGLDPEAELAAWKLRELKRVKRARAAIEATEAERAELERRRNLTAEEREAEDAAHLKKQEEEREDRGKAGYMARYFHKGAFFNDDEYAKAQGLDKRDIMGARFVDQISDKSALPEFLQVRDATKVGKKGRTKYKDLRNEDTGQWGNFRDERRGRSGMAGAAGDVVDERFRSDKSRERMGPSGANATAVGPKRDRVVDAASGPKAESRLNEQLRADTSQKIARPRSRSRSHSPPPLRRDRDSNGHGRRRSYSRSRSPPPRRRDSRDRDRDRDRDRKYRRSVSPKRERRDSRDRYRDRDRDKGRRKRSPSPYGKRHEDKRQRVY